MLILLPAALAAQPVLIYRDPLGRALERAERDTGERDVTPRRAGELVQGASPYLVGAAPLARCDGPPSENADVLRILGEAEELRVAMRPEQSLARLEAGRTAWACLVEPADATLGARLYFLLGIAEAAAGREDAAREAFAAALRSDPDLAWDEDFAPDARPLFEEVRAAPSPPQIALQLVPPEAAALLRVDGRAQALEHGRGALPAGEHLVQLEDGRAVWGRFEGDAWLVVPERVGDALVLSVEQEASRSALAGLAAGAGVERALVPADGATWVLEGGQWERRYVPTAARLSGPLMIAGGVAAAAGAAWMSLERSRALELQGGVDDRTDSATWAALSEDYSSARLRWSVAAGAAGAGAAAAALGVGFRVMTW